MADHVRYEVADPLAVITLDRPEALNAFTHEMLSDIRGFVEAAVADPAVVGIAITGAGRGFCAGLDASVLQATTSGSSARPERGSSDHDLPGLFSYLLQQPKPIIAAVNGVAAGGGFVLATMCDLRFASSEASFLSIFTKRGLIAEHGTTWTLPRLIGTGHALDVLWSSRRVDAAEALRLGLVERVTDPDALLDTVAGVRGRTGGPRIAGRAGRHQTARLRPRRHGVAHRARPGGDGDVRRAGPPRRRRRRGGAARTTATELRAPGR